MRTHALPVTCASSGIEYRPLKAASPPDEFGVTSNEFVPFLALPAISASSAFSSLVQLPVPLSKTESDALPSNWLGTVREERTAWAVHDHACRAASRRNGGCD